MRPAAPAASSVLDAGVSYPSSAAYDAQANVLLVGSYENGMIQRVRTSSETQLGKVPTLPLDDRQRVLRIRIDSIRQRIWVLASDALYLYNAESARLMRRIAIDSLSQHSAEHCMPDMALDRSGSAFVSSALQTKLMRVDADSLEATQHEVEVDADQGKDFGFSAIAFAGEHDTLYAASAMTGALWKVDPVQNRATKLKLSQPVYGACALRAVAAGTAGGGSRDDLTMYVAGGFRDGVQRIELTGADLPYRVTAVPTDRALIVPTDLVVVDRKLLIVSSRLSQHPDFHGDGHLHTPFTLLSIRTP